MRREKLATKVLDESWFVSLLARSSARAAGGKESNLGHHCHRESKDEFNKEGGSHRRWIVAHLLREIAFVISLIYWPAPQS